MSSVNFNSVMFVFASSRDLSRLGARDNVCNSKWLQWRARRKKRELINRAAASFCKQICHERRTVAGPWQGPMPSRVWRLIAPIDCELSLIASSMSFRPDIFATTNQGVRIRQFGLESRCGKDLPEARSEMSDVGADFAPLSCIPSCVQARQPVAAIRPRAVAAMTPS